MGAGGGVAVSKGGSSGRASPGRTPGRIRWAEAAPASNKSSAALTPATRFDLGMKCIRANC